MITLKKITGMLKESWNRKWKKQNINTIQLWSLAVLKLERHSKSYFKPSLPGSVIHSNGFMLSTSLPSCSSKNPSICFLLHWLILVGRIDHSFIREAVFSNCSSSISEWATRFSSIHKRIPRILLLKNILFSILFLSVSFSIVPSSELHNDFGCGTDL